MRAQAFFHDGPCKGTRRTLVFAVQPPEFLNCGGARYVVSPTPDVNYIPYVVQGGPHDSGATQLHGQRDVFVAWRSLQHAWTHTTSRELKKIVAAGHRVRRAVR